MVQATPKTHPKPSWPATIQFCSFSIPRSRAQPTGQWGRKSVDCMLHTVEKFAFGKVGFAFYLTDRVGPSNIIGKPTSNCCTEPDSFTPSHLQIYIFTLSHLQIFSLSLFLYLSLSLSLSLALLFLYIKNWNKNVILRCPLQLCTKWMLNIKKCSSIAILRCHLQDLHMKWMLNIKNCSNIAIFWGAISKTFAWKECWTSKTEVKW